MRRSGRSWTWRELGLASAMLAPSCVVLAVFVVHPLVRAVALGRRRCDASGERCVTTGFGQYVDVLRSIEFQHSLWVTVRFALLTVPLGLVLGVGLAVLADKHLRGIGLLRAVFSSTIATSVAVASLMWLFLLQPSIGALADVGWFARWFPSVREPGWLEDPGTALAAVAVTSVWSGLGLTFVLVTASLRSIPRELVEAAAVDGAGGTVRFWRITVPMIGPTLSFLLVVLTARAFQSYGEIDLLTNGGPSPQESTTTLAYLLYGETAVSADPGLQATGAVLLFVVLLALSAVQVRVTSRRWSGAR